MTYTVLLDLPQSGSPKFDFKGYFGIETFSVVFRGGKFLPATPWSLCGGRKACILPLPFRKCRLAAGVLNTGNGILWSLLWRDKESGFEAFSLFIDTC